jgi:hypothetical protein
MRINFEDLLKGTPEVKSYEEESKIYPLSNGSYWRESSLKNDSDVGELRFGNTIHLTWVDNDKKIKKVKDFSFLKNDQAVCTFIGFENSKYVYLFNVLGHEIKVQFEFLVDTIKINSILVNGRINEISETAVSIELSDKRSNQDKHSVKSDSGYLYVGGLDSNQDFSGEGYLFNFKEQVFSQFAPIKESSYTKVTSFIHKKDFIKHSYFTLEGNKEDKFENKFTTMSGLRAYSSKNFEECYSEVFPGKLKIATTDSKFLEGVFTGKMPNRCTFIIEDLIIQDVTFDKEPVLADVISKLDTYCI